MMTRSVFEHLGSWGASSTLEDVPEQAREAARGAIQDYIGVTLAANDSHVAALLDAYRAQEGVPAAGATTVIGRKATARAELAAFANGAQGHALDFDDCNQSWGGHPTIVVFPAALAAAELVDATGAQLLEAYVIGFEVAAKIGRGVNFTHYERGWHPTATLGAFGAAAAASKLLGLDAERTATALSIAASTASGIKANFGTMTKPLQAGRAAQNGLFAARMAQLGATANPAAFEGEQGFAAVYQGVDTVDLDRVLAPVDEPWDLIDTGVVVKRFPCCASTHGAIEAAIAAHEQLDGSDGIASVEVFAHPRRLRHTNRPRVTTGFEGKFSVQYVVSVALHQGSVGIADFTPEAVARPEVTRIMEVLDARTMPEERWNDDHHFAAEVVVHTPSGSVVSERVERPRGNGPLYALTDDEIAAKFHDCCRAGGIDEAAADELFDSLRSLDGIEDLGQLTKLLA